MSADVSRADLLDRLEREHRALAALLDRLTPAQWATSRAIGAWSVADLLAHLIAHEQLALQEIELALRGEHLQVDHAANDTFNDAAVMAQRGQPFAAVRAAWEASYRDVVAAVVALPDAAFDASGPVVAALQDSIDGALGNNTYGHYAEHRQEIESWLGTMAS